MVELRRASSAVRPRGAAVPRQRGRGAPRGRRQGRRAASRAGPSENRPGWDEDTRAPSLFDTQLRHIFRDSHARPVERRVASQPVAAPRERSLPRHRPGQLRQRLQGSMVPLGERPPVVQAADVEPRMPPPVPEPVRTAWDRSPPQLNLHALTPVPQQLPVAHVQRRSAASLGERLAILLPQAGSLPEAPSGARDVVLMPGTLQRSVVQKPPPPISAMTAPETPEKVQKLSQKLTALLGSSEQSTPSAPPKRPKLELSGQQLLMQNSVRVVGKADLLVDFVLEQIIGDSVKQLDSIPSKSHAYHQRHRDQEGHSLKQWDIMPSKGLAEHQRYHEEGFGTAKPEPLVGSDATLTRMVQSAADRLLLFEHELRMTYGEGTASKVQAAWTPVRPKEETERWGPSCEEDEDWRVGALPAQRVLELERYRARFAHHCMAAREAGIQSGPSGSKTATWVIWPFLADSIAMAIVESTIEEVDNACDDYVDGLIKDEVGCPGEGTLDEL